MRRACKAHQLYRRAKFPPSKKKTKKKKQVRREPTFPCERIPSGSPGPCPAGGMHHRTPAAAPWPGRPAGSPRVPAPAGPRSRRPYLVSLQQVQDVSEAAAHRCQRHGPPLHAGRPCRGGTPPLPPASQRSPGPPAALRSVPEPCGRFSSCLRSSPGRMLTGAWMPVRTPPPSSSTSSSRAGRLSGDVEELRNTISAQVLRPRELCQSWRGYTCLWSGQISVLLCKSLLVFTEPLRGADAAASSAQVSTPGAGMPLLKGK